MTWSRRTRTVSNAEFCAVFCEKKTQAHGPSRCDDKPSIVHSKPYKFFFFSKNSSAVGARRGIVENFSKTMEIRVV